MDIVNNKIIPQIIYKLIFTNNEVVKIISQEYESIKSEILFLTKSKVRLKILVSLYESPSTIKEIHEKTNINYTSITTNLKLLENKGCIHKTKDKYELLSSTKIKIINILHLNNLSNFITDCSKYINEHELNNYNLKSLNELPLINNYEIVHADNIHPYKATEMFKEVFMSTGKVRAICAYLHPNCDEILPYLLSNKTYVTIILHENISKILLKHVTEYDIPSNINNKYFYVKQTQYMFKISMIVSEERVIMGLYRKQEDNYDKNSCIIFKDPTFIKWANQLFNEFEKIDYKLLNVKQMISEMK